MQGHATLADALVAFLRPEVLDGDNKWKMDDGEMVACVCIYVSMYMCSLLCTCVFVGMCVCFVDS